MPRDKKFRMVVLLLVDICVIQFSSFMGLWMRFDMRLQSIPENYRMAAVKYAIPYTLIPHVFLDVERSRSQGSVPHCVRLCVDKPLPDSGHDNAPA